jgi:hypothetical protein
VGGQGVWGHSKSGVGIVGVSVENEAIRGVSSSGHGGVVGINDNKAADAGQGVYGVSENGDGVVGVAKNANRSGVVGVNAAGVGVYGEGRVAGYFKGDVEVTGDIRLTNADCAEAFTVSDQALAEPGTVMVLGDEHFLTPSDQAYDRRVAGVISGAGDFKPGIVLDNQVSEQRRLPVALLGKVFCKVDADFGKIAVGDLLTTSPTPGHAMKAGDQQRAFGAIVGKALRPLQQGRGLIPILIALQ